MLQLDMARRLQMTASIHAVIPTALRHLHAFVFVVDVVAGQIASLMANLSVLIPFAVVKAFARSA
eukprot:m.186952 g.186952  ORF g.186952 m.186952 type:complete len:65 (-) comp16705_c1_seq1:2613-2807(-)